jgi:hypothetical protein
MKSTSHPLAQDNGFLKAIQGCATLAPQVFSKEWKSIFRSHFNLFSISEDEIQHLHCTFFIPVSCILSYQTIDEGFL